ncbi:hypothetical protein C8Q73DRAFT_707585 [Cubamyces lactineus]|nr:hypothetical protein C8Q73DRAFT_707585 [Cubamyces lactineus]
MPDSTQPQQAPPATPSTGHSSTDEAEAFSADQVAEFMNNPHMLLGKRFLHSPPPDEDQEFKGTWEVESYSTRVREGRVNQEFLVLTEDMHGAVLPMGREEVEFMLTYSTYA